ncbi:MAG TPA: VCBS repeat-containing protein, partial [Opitutaceae bacterium]|nr:VCBS repeat-containing protein [Opitutaceae bacterium]
MNRRILVLAGLLAAIACWLAWPRKPVRVERHPQFALEPGAFVPRPVGRPAEGLPWITDVEIADLDGDGLKDILVCDAKRNRIGWIRQVRRGVFEEQDIGGPVPGPAHVSVADLDGTGHLDVLVACMGQILPNNDKIGSVVILKNDGHNHFTNHVVLDKTYRVTDVEAADLSGSGRLDLALAQFGYFQGQVAWLENLGGGRFAEHPLSDLPGAIHA